MSGYPIVLQGAGIRALVVGGGKVAARKASNLAAAGSSVRVVAPDISLEMQALVDSGAAAWTRAEYSRAQIADANLIFAATNSAAVNAAIAADARALRVFVNTANDSEAGDFSTLATHRDGPLLVAVFAGGVPAAAVHIRDAVTRMLDDKVALAIARLTSLRKTHLSRGDAQGWADASAELVGEDFLPSVANGEFDRRIERWG